MRRAVPALVLIAATVSSGLPDPLRNGPPDQRNTSGKKAHAVSLNLEQIAERAIATLVPSEKDTSVVYLDSAEIQAGASVLVGRETVEAPWDAYVAFVDLEPSVNWGHRCRYLLVSRRTGNVRSFDASFPPFLKGPAKTLRVVWKGLRVPDWAVAVR